MTLRRRSILSERARSEYNPARALWSGPACAGRRFRCPCAWGAGVSVVEPTSYGNVAAPDSNAQERTMSRGMPSLTALLGLVALAGYQNRDKLAEMLQGATSGNRSGAGGQQGPLGGLLGNLGGALAGGGVGGLLDGGGGGTPRRLSGKRSRGR